ncbi:hypothetical protein F441_03793 [Phytophthora nicotianae CJ01A1]|uniref:RxLR effector protein n=5 Tax=Phytophthora nicotianae TaxID=4792 RepID=W2QNZ9_PHYN3|nr:hypothetical protein PPTG_08644 [Phytophthora nicotianae INRA-310]ETI53199.1 hypothetical protein F443_03813 [Phytophthora nicotianae P1569]ETK93039.1 hypothetical protein L915_03706 [Phytophthora nicotianae]ETP22997.1 hypothetical protein F441_03793 [Phytophthora nicotianae CJ01A1]ETP50973.1 hypothetical protein F442_03808 [Phytophthora nicotianae P10297]KUF82444.1 hypothetical protein AM587_10011066 [Phytophthora nicotianae]
MRLHSVLMIIAATLAIVNGGVSAAESTNLRNLEATTPVSSINTVQTQTRSKRMLRGDDTAIGENGHGDNYPAKKRKRKPFIEVRLKKALSNPKTVNRLYNQWYKAGYSAKRVAKELKPGRKRELDEVYRNLAQGYAAFLKGKQSQQQVL